MIGLTARQQEILEAIQSNVLEKGFAPTVRELCKRFGLRSTNAIADHLRALQRKGYIEVQPQHHRGIRLKNVPTKKSQPAPTTNVVSVPLYSRVEPGVAPFLPRNQLASLRMDVRGVAGLDLFALRMQGDALSGMGIKDGDNVLFLRRPFQKSGELACMSIGDLVLVRYVHIGRDTMVLMPANQRYGTITIPLSGFKPSDLLGVAVRMWRPIPE